LTSWGPPWSSFAKSFPPVETIRGSSSDRRESRVAQAMNY
jgi:hypothetical protein